MSRLPNIRFEVKPEGLSIWIAKLEDVEVGDSSKDFEAYEQEIFRKIRETDNLDSMKDDPIFRSYRDLYWTFGMDPTKLRVSSEALRRRILRGHNLWRISNVVDVANLASAYHKLPIGLVDNSKREGELRVRIARKGEKFERIGGKILECRGREIVISDDYKIVCFGYATHDSEQTKVSPDTKDVLFLIYGSKAATKEILNSAAEITLSMIEDWIDCRIAAHRASRALHI